MTRPTQEELKAAWMQESGAFEMVHEVTCPDDHGYHWTYTFKRLSDGTYWQCSGVCHGGGIYHQLRECEAYGPYQVYLRVGRHVEYHATPSIRSLETA